MDPEFWKGKRVLITGHTGFKGSWLSLWLQSLEVELLGYALPPPTQPNLFEVAAVQSGMASITGDVTNLAHLHQVIAQFKPEVVIHMAAQSVVHTSYKDPIATYNTNVMGTLYLLEAIRQVGGVKAVVNITSDKCYENQDWVWGYRESDPLGGYDPYSNSKACSELLTAAYRNSFFHPSSYSDHGVAIATARAGNVIAGGDWTANGLIADATRSLLNQQSILVRNPHQTRPWQYILDALNGYLTLAEYLYVEGPAFAEAWNFGPYESDAKPVSWLVEQLASGWGEGAIWEQDKAHQFHEARSLSLDCSKARIELKWQPQVSLRVALEKIVDWTKAFRAGENMNLFSKAEIQSFINSETSL